MTDHPLGNPNSRRQREVKGKQKVVVVMGATGSGKSRLAIDLASFFPIEIINADSMQVYEGLDVLTNKVPIKDQKGVPHHLLGTIATNADFTSKDFRDQAIPVIDDILSRNCLPVIVGGTNYYIQALVSPFLVDDVRDDVNECNPNVPSGQKWGRADNLRYDCCFIWVDASLPVLDRYVEQRVDSMMDAGLLAEVSDMYRPNADYTRGLRQAIGVREFEDFLIYYHSNANRYNLCGKNDFRSQSESGIPAKDLETILHSDDCNLKILLNEAVDKLKANTCRLVRRQKRRLNRLRTFFGWDLHYIDATEALLCKIDDPWRQQVIDPCVDIIRSFLQEDAFLVTDSDMPSNSNCQVLDPRDLWTQYVCEACGNQILRGAHEWEQHKQGRRHRKRVLRLRKKSQNSSMAD